MAKGKRAGCCCNWDWEKENKKKKKKKKKEQKREMCREGRALQATRRKETMAVQVNIMSVVT